MIYFMDQINNETDKNWYSAIIDQTTVHVLHFHFNVKINLSHMLTDLLRDSKICIKIINE